MNAQHMFLMIKINGNLQTVAQNYLGIFRYKGTTFFLSIILIQF